MRLCRSLLPCNGRFVLARFEASHACGGAFLLRVLGQSAAFVLPAELARGKSGNLLKDACKVALVVVANFVADAGAVGVGGHQHALGVIDAQVGQVIDDGDAHFLFEQVGHS